MEKSEEIVLVEDDPGMREALQRLLGAAGFRVAAFPSAEALLESGLAETAECLVLDIQLPGVSGFELRRRLTAAGTDPAVIFITAHDDERMRAEASDLGAALYLAKPFEGFRLVEAVEAVFQAIAKG